MSRPLLSAGVVNNELTCLTEFTQHHLLNPRACSAYLWSEDAARSQDPEVQAAVLSNLRSAASSDPRRQQTKHRGSEEEEEDLCSRFCRGRVIEEVTPLGRSQRQPLRRGSVISAPEPVAASIFHAQAPAHRHLLPSLPAAAVEPAAECAGQIGLIQLVLADSGSAESLLLVLTRRCDTLEVQNAVLRAKVLQLYPPAAVSGAHDPANIVSLFACAC